MQQKTDEQNSKR